MPDLISFAQKHVSTAQTRGIRTAIADAAAETAVWAYSQSQGVRNGSGDLIWEDDWDICCVLDACRWDLWMQSTAQEDWLPGRHTADFRSGWSVGSASPEWYGRTFDPDTLPEERIGLVTANPFAAKPTERNRYLGEATPVQPHLDHCDYVFDKSWGCTVDGEYLDVTHPAIVAERAYRAWKTHDLDRLVVHWMQPHLPFRSRPEWFGRRENLQHFGEPDREGSKSIWQHLRDGEVGREEVWDAYADNLHWGLDEVRRLQQAVNGTLLITSDHGNGMGEWGIWGHPPSRYTKQLRKVPWIRVEGAGKDQFVPVADREEIDLSGSSDREIDEQLKALGYR